MESCGQHVHLVQEEIPKSSSKRLDRHGLPPEPADYGFEVLSQSHCATHVDSQHRERLGAHRIKADRAVEKAPGLSRPVDALRRRAGLGTVGRDAQDRSTRGA